MKKTIKTISETTSTETNNLPMITQEMIDQINEPNPNTDTETITGENETDTGTTEPEPLKLITMTDKFGKTFQIIDPETIGPDTDKTPISKRQGELMILKLTDFRTSGDHPNIKKHPKWMIQSKWNGQERWMDLTKEEGFNIKEGLIILSRSQIRFKGEMGSFIIGPMIRHEIEQ